MQLVVVAMIGEVAECNILTTMSVHQPSSTSCELHNIRRRRRRRRSAAVTAMAAATSSIIIQMSLVFGGTVAFMTPITRRQWHHDVRFALSTKDDTTLSQTAMESATLTKTMKSREESFVPPFPTSAEHSLNGHKIIDEQHIPSTEEINKDVVINTQVEDESFNQFNVVNDLVSVSERLLDTLDTTSSTFTTRNAKSYSSLARLSKAHHSMMAKTSNMRRQRFVTGKYPLYVSVKQNPTKKWLGYAESQIYLNGTSIEKSLASYDIFHWLDDKEREELHGDYEFLSLELLAEIHVKKPGYVNILPKEGAGRSLNPSEMQRGGSNGGVFGQWKSWKLRNDDINKIDDTNDESNSSDGERLWVTGFSLTNQRGEMHTLDVKSGVMSTVNDRTARAIKWPNEVLSIPRQLYTNNQRSHLNDDHRLHDALLVTDGFLVPGKDKGGLYVVRKPGNDRSEWIDCLTGITNLQGATINVGGGGDWFYHRATWIDLTGDGRLSILAARAKILPLLKGSSSNGSYDSASGSGGKPLGAGQLVWLECPKPHSFDIKTGTPLDKDGTVFDPFSSRNTPWALRCVMLSMSRLQSQPPANCFCSAHDVDKECWTKVPMSCSALRISTRPMIPLKSSPVNFSTRSSLCILSKSAPIPKLYSVEL